MIREASIVTLPHPLLSVDGGAQGEIRKRNTVISTYQHSVW